MMLGEPEAPVSKPLHVSRKVNRARYRGARTF
jgi:hypothetical protein